MNIGKHRNSSQRAYTNTHTVVRRIGVSRAHITHPYFWRHFFVRLL